VGMVALTRCKPSRGPTSLINMELDGTKFSLIDFRKEDCDGKILVIEQLKTLW
jgi:hypothetical protein